MADRVARPSTDEESAPLLDDRNDPNIEDSNRPLSERIGNALHEPLTTIEQILLALILILLLLAAVFIGLFAGAQHKLHTRPEVPEGTITATTTAQATTTLTATTSVATTVIGTTTVTATTILPPPPGPTSPPTETTCLTPQCVLLSARILSSLDTTQDPCENFYDYASGGWRKSHPLPADKGRLGTFDQLSQENQQIVRDILESDKSEGIVGFKSSYDEELLKKLRDLYSSCMDEDTLDKWGESPLRELAHTVKNLFRGRITDITDPSVKVADGMTAAVSFLHRRGIPGLFDLGIEGDAAVDPNYMMLWFSQPDLGLPSKEYFTEESIIKVYTDVISSLLLVQYQDDDHLFVPEGAQNELVIEEPKDNVWPPWPWPPWGGDDDGDDYPRNRKEAVQKLAEKVVKLESRIANASLDLDVLQGDPVGTYNKVPITNLTATLSQFNFDNYIDIFTPPNSPEYVIVTSPEFMKSLSEILDTTDSKVIEAYLVSRVALYLSPRLGMSTDSWKASRRLTEVLSGIKPGAVGDRGEYCVNQVDQALGFATGRFFVNETFAGDSQDKATGVIKDIIQTFKRSLRNIAWMDEESADAAAEKADALSVKVGFPLSPDTRSAQSIANYYRLVNIDKTLYFDSLLSADMSDVYKEWQQLGGQRDKQAWEMTPATVNAYYNPPGNEIVFPAGILRPPFFSVEWPSYLQFGAFGQVAAHELSHAFDSAGRMYNQEGKLEEWWTNATSAGFQKKLDCIVKQYSAYTIDDGNGHKVHVNGNLTSGENIGDSGIIQAFRAWKAQFDASYADGQEYLLPALNYTREQLFFIAFGQIWAQNIKPASAVARVRSDPHSPNQYRVDGTLSNVPEFAKAFNCPAGSKLNPPREKQCLFW